MIYLVGSLRNPEIPKIAEKIRTAGHEVFDGWFSAGIDADDHWKSYAMGRGQSYAEALADYPAQHVFNFDLTHLRRADTVVLALPAGKSGHLELGWALGQGKRGYILQAPDSVDNLSIADWAWLAGLYEGEGSITRNGPATVCGMKIQLNSIDKDVVEKAHLISGSGYVYGPYKNSGSNLKKQGEFKDQWRWAVHKRNDILRIVGGMWPHLMERRRAQIEKVAKTAGISWPEDPTQYAACSPRMDVMYNFADGVFADIYDLLEAL